MRFFPMTVAAAAAAALIAGTAAAQSRVDAKRDWSIFEAGEGAQKVCWIVSKPKSSTAERGGQTVEVNRGDIYLMVSVRPADNVKNEVSYLAGYPFAEGSEVTVTVGSNNFTMFTDGENAWTSSQADDDRLAGAFRGGSDARVVGQSSRGTTTRDTFSLMGFTDALEAAQARCS